MLIKIFAVIYKFVIILLFIEILEDTPKSDDTLSLQKARKMYAMCMDTGMYAYT